MSLPAWGWSDNDLITDIVEVMGSPLWLTVPKVVAALEDVGDYRRAMYVRNRATLAGAAVPRWFADAGYRRLHAPERGEKPPYVDGRRVVVYVRSDITQDELAHVINVLSRRRRAIDATV